MTGERGEDASSIDSFLREVASAPDVPVHDPIGETLGRYRVTSLLGKGGMGRVYEAEDQELRRRVAIKFLPAAFAQRAESFARFVRERAVTADLEHPAIIPVYDSGIWSSGEPFFVMRQIRGEPLDRRLAAAKSLEERLLLLGNVIAAADAVAFAHSRGVIHRDLKPANVLVGSFGETLVADWGLAKRVREDEAGPPEESGGTTREAGDADPHQTEVGAILGTPAYMAPEQAEGRAVDARADVYALGAILHELLLGRPPSRAADTTAPRARPGAPPLETLPATLGDLAAIAQKAVSLDPAQRYGDASELALELRRFQAGQLVGAKRYTLGELLRRWVVRHRAVVGVGGTMGVVLVVVVVVGLARVLRERDAARAERTAADAARREATLRNEALMLLQARAELTHDPTASLAWLKRYPKGAGQWNEVIRVGADAVARGVARRVWNLGVPLGSVAFSPDGRTLAVGGIDGTLSLIDRDGGSRRSYHADDGVGVRVVFSPDGSVLATSDEVESVRLWDVAAGTSRRLAGEHVGGAHVVFSKDGRMLLVRHTGGADHLWSVPVGEPIALPDADGPVAFGSRPDLLFVTHGDRIEERELAAGRVLAATRIDGAPYDLALSGDGQWVAASRFDALALWNPETGQTRRIPTGKVVVRVLVPSPTGSRFVSCGLVSEVWTFDAAAAKGSLLSAGERCTRQAFSFSPDGNQFISAAMGGELRIHDGEVQRVLLGHDVAIADAAFSPDGRWIASVSGDGSARLWDLDRGDVRVERSAKPLERIAAGGRMLVREDDGSAAVVDVMRGERRPLGIANSTRGSLSWNGKLAVVRGADGSLVVSDVDTKKTWSLGPFDPPGAHGSAETLSADGSVLAQADDRGGVRMVDLASGKATILGQLGDACWGIAMSSDGRRLAAGGKNGTVREWEVATGEGRDLLHVQAIVWDVAISPDGRRVAAASNEGIVYVVDVESGEVKRLVGHVGAVSSVDFLPDGARLLSAAPDGTVRLWDLTSDEGVVVRREAKSVYWVRTSVDGSLVLAQGQEAWVWKSAVMPPLRASPTDFLAWVGAQTSAEVDDASGRVRSP